MLIKIVLLYGASQYYINENGNEEYQMAYMELMLSIGKALLGILISLNLAQRKPKTININSPRDMA